MKKREITLPKSPSGTFPMRPLLYVEDNDDNWEVAKLHLGPKFLLYRAANDEEACKLIVSEGPRLCAILMDIELQGSALNGIELARLVRGINKRASLPAYARAVVPLTVPLIFLTAYNQSYSQEQLMSAGGDSVMAKPVDFKALNMALMNLQVSRLGRSGRG